VTGSPVDNLRGADRPDWDSYGARALSPEVIELAERIYENIRFVPTVDGGFQVEFRCGGVDAEIEFSEGGELEGVYVSKGRGWTG
jgi:hypothetical protein